jgi:hypothetical protein
LVSQVSRDEFLSSGVVVHGGGEAVEVAAEWGGHGWVVEDVAEAWSQESGVDSGEEQGQVQPVVGVGFPS